MKPLPLLTALTLLPTTALAQVCDQQRPDWNPASGPATGLDELAFVFSTLPGLGVLGALTLAILTGGRLYWGLSTLFPSLVGLALWVQQANPDAITRAAIAEGCVGPATLPVGVLAAIALASALMLIRSLLRPPLSDAP